MKSNDIAKGDRDNNYDLLRVISTIAVICIHLVKKCILIKILIKDIFKAFYRIFGNKINRSEKKKTAFNEWMLTVDNNRQKASLCKSIDRVLADL